MMGRGERVKKIIALAMAAMLAVGACIGMTACSSKDNEADQTDWATVDMSGAYYNGNSMNRDAVIIEKTGDNEYDVTVQIYRLTEMKGTGTCVDGAMEMALKDVNDNDLSATFYEEEDSTYTFKVTESSWDLLDANESIGGFAIDEMIDNAAADTDDDQNADAADVDISGDYYNGNSDSRDAIYIEKVGAGQYSAKVDIHRLTEMEGTACLTNGVIEMTLTDASGNQMLASFVEQSDGTYTFEVTDSSWSLLETGTQITGFATDEMID